MKFLLNYHIFREIYFQSCFLLYTPLFQIDGLEETYSLGVKLFLMRRNFALKGNFRKRRIGGSLYQIGGILSET
jgi:hypothetical protein